MKKFYFPQSCASFNEFTMKKTYFFHSFTFHWILQFMRIVTDECVVFAYEFKKKHTLKVLSGREWM